MPTSSKGDRSGEARGHTPVALACVDCDVHSDHGWPLGRRSLLTLHVADINAEHRQVPAACRVQDNHAEWERVSQGALERVYSNYTWTIYASRLLTLQNIYSFWRHTTHMERSDTRRYLEMLYMLKMRPLVGTVPVAEESLSGSVSPQPGIHRWVAQWA